MEGGAYSDIFGGVAPGDTPIAIWPEGFISESKGYPSEQNQTFFLSNNDRTPQKKLCHCPGIRIDRDEDKGREGGAIGEMPTGGWRLMNWFTNWGKKASADSSLFFDIFFTT